MKMIFWSLLFLGAGILRGQTEPWTYPDRPYRIRVDVTTTAPRMPVSAPFDPGAGRTFDPASIAVGHGQTRVPAQISESVEAGAAGTVSWLVRAPGRAAYFLYFDDFSAVRRPNRETREPIGGGDAFFYNRPDGFDNLGVGMKNDQPIAIDWDGDGKTDILQRNLYSATYGEPWWGIYFWRNIGTNENPSFDRYVRLRADGHFIDDMYASYQVIDWDHDGKPDLLCGTGGGKKKGQLKVYRNTGQRDSLGLPILQSGPMVERMGGGELSYGMRLLEWTANGVMDLFTLRLKVQYFPTQEMDATLYRHSNLSKAGEAPHFGPGEAVELHGRTTYDEWPTDLLDVNGDGKPDLIGSTRGLAERPLKTCVVAWENTGTASQPAFAKAPTCLIDTSPEGFAIPTAAAPWPGLFVSYLGSWLRYLEPTEKGFQDRGPRQARGLPCSSGGYNSVDVVDWDGDGDWDFVVGNEVGFVQLIENVSSGGRTMFRTARKIPLTGDGSMYAGRSQFIDDRDPERPLGQSKPAVVDWDGDGDLDVLVGNNSNRVAYFENVGTRRDPHYAPMRTLTHDGGERFSFRARPAPVDWNGDGLMDLVAGRSDGINRNDGKDVTVCLYTRYRASDGSLRLHEGKPFRMTDGSELRTPIPYRGGFEAVDWDGDGDFDLLANEDSKLVLYRNEGTNAQPVFRRETLKFYGQPLSVSHHDTSAKAVDWNHDGSLDLITGGESGWVYYFRRSALDALAPPKVEVSAVEVHAKRFARSGNR